MENIHVQGFAHDASGVVTPKAASQQPARVGRHYYGAETVAMATGEYNSRTYEGTIPKTRHAIFASCQNYLALEDLYTKSAS